MKMKEVKDCDVPLRWLLEDSVRKGNSDMDGMDEATRTFAVWKKLMDIEWFVDTLRAMKSDAVFSEIDWTSASTSKLAQGVCTLPTWRRHYSEAIFDVGLLPKMGERVAFSEKVQLFLDFVADHKKTLLDLQAEINRRKMQHGHDISETQAFRLNRMLKELQRRAKSPEFAKRLSRRKEFTNRTVVTLHGLVDDLFSCYARLLVVRVDLGYQKDTHASNHACSPTADLEMVLEHRNKLVERARYRPEIFGNCVGYVMKLEQGIEDGGCHLHTVFFFDGSKVQAGYYYAEEIGKYWVQEITGGVGRFHNCNGRQDGYRYNGIGIVNHDDADKVFALKERVLTYLAKSTQHLTVKTSKRLPVITHSHSPVIADAEKRRGRKRASGRAQEGDL